MRYCPDARRREQAALGRFFLLPAPALQAGVLYGSTLTLKNYIGSFVTVLVSFPISGSEPDYYTVIAMYDSVIRAFDSSEFGLEAVELAASALRLGRGIAASTLVDQVALVFKGSVAALCFTCNASSLRCAMDPKNSFLSPFGVVQGGGGMPSRPTEAA